MSAASRAASALGPVTVRAEGVRLNGKPVCNRFAIEYPNGIGHIEFSDENAAAIERAVNSHADLLAALEAALPRMAHRIQCYRCRPTEEWAQHGSVSLDGCECEIQQVRAAIAKAKGAQS